MFDLGWPEFLVIAIVLIVVVGPKDLPRVLRGFGRTTTKLRGMAGDFRRQFDEALREAELEDMKSLVDDVKKLDPRNEIRSHLKPLEQAGRDIRKGLDEATKPPQATPAKANGDGAPAVEAKPSEPNKVDAAKPAAPAVKPAPAKAGKSKAAPKPAAATKAPAKQPAARKATTKAAPRGSRKKSVGTLS